MCDFAKITIYAYFGKGDVIKCKFWSSHLLKWSLDYIAGDFEIDRFILFIITDLCVNVTSNSTCNN